MVLLFIYHVLYNAYILCYLFGTVSSLFGTQHFCSTHGLPSLGGLGQHLPQAVA